MGKQSTGKLFLHFVAWTFLAVASAAAIVTIFRYEAIDRQAEEDAAVAVSGALGPLLAEEAGSLTESDIAAFTFAAQGLLSDQVRAISLWTGDGRLLATTHANRDSPGDAGALSRAAEGDVFSSKEESQRGDLLVSYAPLTAGAVLEIRQDYGPVADSIASGRRTVLIITIGASVGLLLILPAILWAAVRGLKGEYDRLLYLYRTGHAMRSTLDLTDVLERLARDAALFAGGQLALATLLDEETDDLILKGSYEREGDSSAQHHRKVEEWFLRRCAGTGETVQARLPSFPFRSLLGHDRKSQTPVAVVCVPIRGRERSIGVITVVRGQGQGGLPATEVSVLEEMVAQAAMAVEQAVLFAKVRRHAAEVEMSYDTTLRVLMAALDTKDAVSHGHSERVSRLTVAIAREMNVPEERLVDIERGALLHDVGKIGVPDKVLHKDATLNEGEWEAMRKHPLLAGLMVSKVEFLEGALPILLYHHERYDGSGYPFGLEGEAIPLEARIFAAVDAYDAMTSDRPYRRAMSPEQALQDIQRNEGTQFDPRVVEALTRVLARMQPIAERAA